MTLRMYAQRKGLPLEKVEVRLGHQKVHLKDCEECETKNTMLDEIQTEIVLEGDLDESQKDRLLKIAGRCPVHRTLTGDIRILSKLVEKS